MCLTSVSGNTLSSKGHSATPPMHFQYTAMKVIYKITYPNGKIYVGKELTDTLN